MRFLMIAFIVHVTFFRRWIGSMFQPPSTWGWSRRDENAAPPPPSFAASTNVSYKFEDKTNGPRTQYPTTFVNEGVGVGRKRQVLGALSSPAVSGHLEQEGNKHTEFVYVRPWKQPRSQPCTQYTSNRIMNDMGIQEPLNPCGMEEDGGDDREECCMPSKLHHAASHVTPPTLAGQSRRQTAAYRKDDVLLSHPSLTSPEGMSVQQQQLQNNENRWGDAPRLASDSQRCDVCLPPPRPDGPQSCFNYSLRQSRHPQEMAAIAQWAGGLHPRLGEAPPLLSWQKQESELLAEDRLERGQREPMHVSPGRVQSVKEPATSTAGCWASVAQCRHCERGVCKTCLRHCEACQEPFCSICSTVDYGGAFERVLCIDCGH